MGNAAADEVTAVALSTILDDVSQLHVLVYDRPLSLLPQDGRPIIKVHCGYMNIRLCE
jgi:hypothetical protein